MFALQALSTLNGMLSSLDEKEAAAAAAGSANSVPASLTQSSPPHLDLNEVAAAQGLVGVSNAGQLGASPHLVTSPGNGGASGNHSAPQQTEAQAALSPSPSSTGVGRRRTA